MPNYTPIDSTKSFKPDRVQMQKLREKPVTSIAVRQCLIHTHERITPFGLQSFFIPTIKRLQQYYNSKPFNLTLTSLEEGASSWIYTKTRRSSLGGAQIPRRHIKSAEGESINAWSVSSWARSESHWVQLSIGGLIWLTPQPVDWRIHQKSSSWAKNVLRREGGWNSP